ncbi:MAG: rod shape-determining protein MreC [Gemmatimonadota bacterium]
MLDFDVTRRERRRDAALAGGVLALAFFLWLMPPEWQSVVRANLRATALRPFLATQEAIGARRALGVDVVQLRAQRDSLGAVAAAQATLAEENARLRATLGLRSRLAEEYIPADVIQVGLDPAESTFLVSVGAAEGVQEGSIVLTPEGLLGVVWEVDEHRAQAIDWTHPDFRASAMTADGAAYGLVEVRRGRFREEDVLALTGAPFHSDIGPGRRVVTSGRGDVFPRGILLGTVLGIDEADTGWRKSYLLLPAVRPEAVRTVLVRVGANQGDLADVWNVSAPPDTASNPDTASIRGPAGGG